MKVNEAVEALAALAQDKRLAIYRLLVQHGASGLAAGEIAAELGVTPATLSFHLKELGHAGLVKARHQGRFIFYSADFEAMTKLIGFLTENCCGGDSTACLPQPAATRRSAKKSAMSKTETQKA
jgi:ArsR family transcriptional regulator, arsenate/arsenite/antimonite-responsive transcriptional repressor